MEEGNELVMEMVPYENENEIISSMEEGKELEMELEMVPYYTLTESFYRKLKELLDPSGFNLIYDVRKTSLDLYLFYLEVTKRGGYHQVDQEKKWGEVVSALKLEGNNATLCDQLEKLYKELLYKFETLYFYRSPATGSNTVERNQNSTTSLSQLMDDQDYLKARKISEHYSSQITGIGYQEFQVVQQAPSKNKEKKKRRGAPIGQSGYNIFLKQECARLKANHPDVGGRKIIDMAIDAWNKLSDNEKRPYEEASMKIKEEVKEAPTNNKEKKKHRGVPRGQKSAYQIFLKHECARLKADHQFQGDRKLKAIDAWKMMSPLEKLPYEEESMKIKEEIKAAMIQKSTEDLNRDEERPIVCGDYYSVTSQPLSNDSFGNNAAVDLTEKVSEDPFFPGDLNDHHLLDFPSGEPK
ncbi:high mobility group B protein 10 isoform X2 [Medicago truncatula]|uniref:high mobility group B protein 10 isoform X2 n=1 Tax=Medicago truncatula TaxID=3880 RepID=UPI000D2F19AA|nr:high mobility group B protein 10 isoform X2 [Medicago truncatula]